MLRHTTASRAAEKKAKELGLTLTSGYRSPAKDKAVGGSGHGDHTQGEAMDFAGSWKAMEQLAEWAHRSGMFTQVIFKDRDYRTGRTIGGHMDHVHLAWDSKKNPSPAAERDELLKKGSEGSLVMAWQGMLAAMYYDIKVDGKFGDKTAAATKEWQRSMKITVDGIVGDQSWGKMTGLFFS